MSGWGGPLDWDRLYREYLASRKVDASGWARYDLVPPTPVLHTLGAPTTEDLEWLIAGLRDERKWFVGFLLRRAPKISDVFLEPLLDAGIAEMEASAGPRYTRVCLDHEFDRVRMRNHLYSVIERGDDNQKAGAVYCLYGLGRGFGNGSEWDEGSVVRDLPLEIHRAEVLLRTFLETKHRLLRCAILVTLPFDLMRYPEELRPLVGRTIASAADSEDEHERWLIRYRGARGTAEHNRIGAERPEPRRL